MPKKPLKNRIFDKIAQKIIKINSGEETLKRLVYKGLKYFIAIAGIFVIFSIIFPATAAVILNIIWVTAFAIVVIFLTLGVFVIMGLREEVAQALDILLEGSLTLIDTVELLKQLWKQFIKVLKEFLISAAPVFAFILAGVVYIVFLLIYKSYGRYYDVVGLTIILTVFSVVSLGLLTRSSGVPSEVKNKWFHEFKKNFHRGFTDGLEVALFAFFLTMDSTNLFFLPKELNNPLTATIGDYNFMVRGFRFDDHTKITLTLIIATIIVEIIRYLMRLIAVAWKYYEGEGTDIYERVSSEVKLNRFKTAFRRSFTEFKDDITTFITFTTVLLLVFLLFPRLKLFTLAIASGTSLLLDLTIRSRLTVLEKSNDLISRIISRTFKV